MIEKNYTTYEIAKFCGVYPSSILNWIEEGRIKSHTTPGGHHRVKGSDLLAFFKEYKMPIPPELATRKQILLVDDDKEVLSCLEKTFRRHSSAFQVRSCATGTEALIAIGTAVPDLVVLDIVLPGMDGIEVCRILKAKPETRDIRIIGISGQRELSPRKQKEYAVDAFFQKPLDLVELLEKSAALLGVALSGAVARGA